jgi:hypothetical protein
VTHTALTIRPVFDTPPREGEAMIVAPGILWMRLLLPIMQTCRQHHRTPPEPVRHRANGNLQQRRRRQIQRH